MVKIIKATKDSLEQIIPLFDQYRMFYNRPSDEKGAREFLEARFDNSESTIFIALVNEQAVGFVQLYPTFSSVSMQRFFILNDLYVNTSFRQQRIGEALLERAKKFCKEQNHKGLALETAVDNPAQKLYEKLGWVKDTDYYHYFWEAK
jgi:ribosomal protein S18 acetylase RimI-like enzyme